MTKRLEKPQSAAAKPATGSLRVFQLLLQPGGRPRGRVAINHAAFARRGSGVELLQSCQRE